MEIIFSILIVASAFSFVFYLHQKHLYKLEQLLKAKDLTEYKVMERMQEEAKTLVEEPEDLQDNIREKSPQEIRNMFVP